MTHWHQKEVTGETWNIYETFAKGVTPFNNEIVMVLVLCTVNASYYYIKSQYETCPNFFFFFFFFFFLSRVPNKIIAFCFSAHRLSMSYIYAKRKIRPSVYKLLWTR